MDPFFQYLGALLFCLYLIQLSIKNFMLKVAKYRLFSLTDCLTLLSNIVALMMLCSAVILMLTRMFGISEIISIKHCSYMGMVCSFIVIGVSYANRDRNM